MKLTIKSETLLSDFPGVVSKILPNPRRAKPRVLAPVQFENQPGLVNHARREYSELEAGKPIIKPRCPIFIALRKKFPFPATSADPKPDGRHIFMSAIFSTCI